MENLSLKSVVRGNNSSFFTITTTVAGTVMPAFSRSEAECVLDLNTNALALEIPAGVFNAQSLVCAEDKQAVRIVIARIMAEVGYDKVSIDVEQGRITTDNPESAFEYHAKGTMYTVTNGSACLNPDSANYEPTAVVGALVASKNDSMYIRNVRLSYRVSRDTKAEIRNLLREEATLLSRVAGICSTVADSKLDFAARAKTNALAAKEAMDKALADELAGK
jgi:hypothetical protein